MSQLTKFHLFPNLPVEIRLAIWALCLPRQVMTVECPIPLQDPATITEPETEDNKSQPCSMYETSGSASPAVAQVCRESRHETFRHGGWVQDPVHWSLLHCWSGRDRSRHYYRLVERPRFQPRSDTLFLMWNPQRDEYQDIAVQTIFQNTAKTGRLCVHFGMLIGGRGGVESILSMDNAMISAAKFPGY